MRSFFVFLIRIYQKTLSPDHGILSVRYPFGFCHFWPSCSMYATEVLQKKPLPQALMLIVWRLLRCNPFTKPKINKPSVLL